MPADEEIKDPVPSPEPTEGSPSEPSQPAPDATPEPTDGSNAAPPAASDQESATPPGKKEAPVEDVLDRLSPDIPKPTPQEEPPSEGEDKVEPNEAEQPDQPEGEYKEPDEKELAGYHSKTRKRIKGIIEHRDKVIGSMRPYADFANEIVTEAAKHDVPVQNVKSWINLGYEIRKQNPEAMAAMADLLVSNGYEFAAEQAAPDLSGVEATLDRLHRNMNIDDDALATLKEALKRSVPEKKQAPQQRQPPVQQSQQHQIPPQQHAIQQTYQYVAQREAQLQKQHGAKWPAIRQKIYAEAAKREANLPVEVVNDPVEMRARFAECAAHVLALESVSRPAPKPPPVQSSLRASPSPTPTKIPQKGTPEYEDFVMTYGVPDKG